MLALEMHRSDIEKKIPDLVSVTNRLIDKGRSLQFNSRLCALSKVMLCLFYIIFRIPTFTF